MQRKLEKHSLKIRVRYGETDRMGVVHHSSYVLYLEEARTAMLRDRGYSYKQLEDSGIILPVYELELKYLRPAYYDEVLTVETTVEQLSGVRIIFGYRILNQDGSLLATARATLVFTDSKTFKPVRPPAVMRELFGN